MEIRSTSLPALTVLTIFAASFCASTSPSRAVTNFILPLGDSITDDFNVPGSYRTELASDLVFDGYAFQFQGSQPGYNSSASLIAMNQTHQEGHTGYRIDQIYDNLKGDDGTSGNNGGHWLDGGGTTGRSAIMPNIVLLHIGTNDASQGETLQQMETKLSTLLDNLKFDLPTTQVIVASLIPRTDNMSLELLQEQYNAAIPGILAGENSSNFHFLDMHEVLNAGDLSDGVHPTQGGYNKMGDAWAAAIVAVPEPATDAMLVTGFFGVVLSVCRRRVLG